MTPAARVQAAIEILDRILDGDPTEKALTGWARRSRFAGSKDRAAVRDHVFDAIRCKRSFAALGGAMTGRGLMLGALRSAGSDPAAFFTGVAHAPDPLTTSEVAAGRAHAQGAEALDLPDWLWQAFQLSLGDDAEPVAQALRQRAPVHLRVNAARLSREDARAALAGEGVETEPHPAAPYALTVVEGARRIRQSAAFRDGLVELQDAASQAVVAALPLQAGMRVLDYCAGGGGKALAMAAQAPVELDCHDAAPARMRDLPARAARAGAKLRVRDSQALKAAPLYDLVLTDVPCSGSGSWRRAPDGKWRLTPDGLKDLNRVQSDILDRAADHVGTGGWLAYATCSVLEAENEARVAAFLERHSGWSCALQRRWLPHQGTDGFFLALLTRSDNC